MIGSSNDETNFLHKLLVTNTQVSKICKAFANVSSANVNFSKTLLAKMIQSGGILGELIAGIPQLIYLTGKEVPTKRISLAKDATPTSAKKNKILL